MQNNQKDNLKLGSAKKKIFIVSLLLFLTAAGYTAAAVILVRDAEKGHDIATVLSAREARARDLSTRHTVVANTKKERAKLDSYFLDEKRVAEFLNYIEALGRTIGLETSTTYLGVSEGVLTVDLRASGPFASMIRYTGLIERLPYKIDIRKMSLQTKNDGGWSGIYSLAIASFQDI